MNRMWTRMACVVCAVGLLLCTSAMAKAYNTVQELGMQAQAGWHESYAAHGRVVDVDMEIRFPAVDTMPLLKVAECVEEDVLLCGLDSVMASVEREIFLGHIRKVYELEFGYVLYDDPAYIVGEGSGVEGHYYAVPSWTLNCLYMQNPEEELPEYGVEGATADRNSLEYATLVFDAQTGEMLDFTSREKDRAHYRGVMTRDDVGK